MLNLAFYKFVKIADSAGFRQEMWNLCETLELKGTLLVAHEGINGCLVGTEKNALAFVDIMKKDPRFSDVDFKRSASFFTPFRKLVVKVKQEIVTMGVPGIAPEHFTAEHLPAETLKGWLDAGDKDVVLLDTRNDYEVKIGTFEGALDPNIQTFRTFPQWIDENQDQLKNKKVVAFCTGGIRCEKATAYMRQVGLENVFQLEGGILKYLEATSSSAENHWQGDCFVFDYRVAVDKSLQPTRYQVCYACRAPLTPEEIALPSYKEGVQCLHCLGKTEAKNLRNSQIQAENNKRAAEGKKARSQRKKLEIQQQHLWCR